MCCGIAAPLKNIIEEIELTFLCIVKKHYEFIRRMKKTIRTFVSHPISLLSFELENDTFD